MNFQEIKTKKQECEREIETIISQFEKYLPEEIVFDSAVVLKTHETDDEPSKPICTIKLKMTEL